MSRNKFSLTRITDFLTRLSSLGTLKNTLSGMTEKIGEKAIKKATGAAVIVAGTSLVGTGAALTEGCISGGIGGEPGDGGMVLTRPASFIADGIELAGFGLNDSKANFATDAYASAYSQCAGNGTEAYVKSLGEKHAHIALRTSFAELSAKQSETHTLTEQARATLAAQQRENKAQEAVTKTADIGGHVPLDKETEKKLNLGFDQLGPQL